MPKSIPNHYLSFCPVCAGERDAREYRERCAFFTRYGWRMHMHVMHKARHRKVAQGERIFLDGGHYQAKRYR